MNKFDRLENFIKSQIDEKGALAIAKEVEALMYKNGLTEGPTLADIFKSTRFSEDHPPERHRFVGRPLGRHRLVNHPPERHRFVGRPLGRQPSRAKARPTSIFRPTRSPFTNNGSSPSC